MPAVQHFGEVKSAPLIEQSTIFSKKSNDSDSTISYKSCGALDDIQRNDNNVYFDDRPSVKALARKINENYKSAAVFGSSKTSKDNHYGNSGDRAKSKILSYTDGDLIVNRCVDDQSFAVNGRLEASDSDNNITRWEQQKSGVIELDSRNDHVCQRIVDVVEANRIYYCCLKNIADAGNFQKVGDVAKYASSVLENVGQVIPEKGDWVNGCAEEVSGGHAKEGRHALEKRPSYGANYCELECVKLKTLVAVLKKDKRDLLNILKGYETENVNKLSLEKRLKAEQNKNDELQAMISSVYDEKIRSL